MIIIPAIMKVGTQPAYIGKGLYNQIKMFLEWGSLENVFVYCGTNRENGKVLVASLSTTPIINDANDYKSMHAALRVNSITYLQTAFKKWSFPENTLVYAKQKPVHLHEVSLAQNSIYGKFGTGEPGQYKPTRRSLLLIGRVRLNKRKSRRHV